MHFTLFPNHAAAMAAIQTRVDAARADWDLDIGAPAPVGIDWVQPCDRQAVAGRPLVGVEVIGRGPFARSDEQDRGIARVSAGYAWPA